MPLIVKIMILTSLIKAWILRPQLSQACQKSSSAHGAGFWGQAPGCSFPLHASVNFSVLVLSANCQANLISVFRMASACIIEC